MGFPLQLEQGEYETLIEFARQGTLNSDGTVNQDKALGLDSWLRMIEQKNGITRSFVWVQWQEQDAPLPRGVNFPKKWPPELRAAVALVSRPIAKSDVTSMLNVRAKKLTSVLVTRDPAALVGWTELDEFFK
jgi:hypothetical protein